MRDEAAHGIVRLLRRPVWRGSDAAPVLRTALNDLLADQNAVVRMQAAQGLQLVGENLPDSAGMVAAVHDRLLNEGEPLVLSVLLDILRRAVAQAPRDVDTLLEEFATSPQGAFLADPTSPSDSHGREPAGDPWTGRDVTVDLMAPMLVFLAVVAGTPFASQRLTTWFANSLLYIKQVETLVDQLRPYLNSVDGQGQQAAFGLLTDAAVTAQSRPCWLIGFRRRGSGRAVGGGWSGSGRGVCRSTRRPAGSG